MENCQSIDDDLFINLDRGNTGTIWQASLIFTWHVKGARWHARIQEELPIEKAPNALQKR